MIRMIELLPDVCNVAEVSLDIDKLLLKLPDCSFSAAPTFVDFADPKHPFADLLTATVGKSRRQGVLPYTILSDEAARAMQPAEVPPMATSNLAELLPIPPANLGAFPWMSASVAPDDSAAPADDNMWPIVSRLLRFWVLTL